MNKFIGYLGLVLVQLQEMWANDEFGKTAVQCLEAFAKSLREWSSPTPHNQG